MKIIHVIGPLRFCGMGAWRPNVEPETASQIQWEQNEGAAVLNVPWCVCSDGYGTLSNIRQRSWRVFSLCRWSPQALAAHRAYLLTARVPSKVSTSVYKLFICDDYFPPTSAHCPLTPVHFFFLFPLHFIFIFILSLLFQKEKAPFLSDPIPLLFLWSCSPFPPPLSPLWECLSVGQAAACSSTADLFVMSVCFCRVWDSAWRRHKSGHSSYWTGRLQFRTFMGLNGTAAGFGNLSSSATCRP